jgi:hypothetical protein
VARRDLARRNWLRRVAHGARLMAARRVNSRGVRAEARVAQQFGRDDAGWTEPRGGIDRSGGSFASARLCGCIRAARRRGA